MAAATQDRNTNRKLGNFYSYPVAADAVIFVGVLIALDANGYAVPAAADSVHVIGRADQGVDNTGGLDGDVSIEVSRGRFAYENSAANPVTQAHVGQQATLEDDQTVALPGGAGPNAGRIDEVDGDLVWIDTRNVG